MLMQRIDDHIHIALALRVACIGKLFAWIESDNGDEHQNSHDCNHEQKFYKGKTGATGMMGRNHAQRWRSVAERTIRWLLRNTVAAQNLLPCYTDLHMQKTRGFFVATVLALGVLSGVLVTQSGLFTAGIADECNGKPYGASGCPLIKGNSTSIPATCGNGKVDNNEECDNGQNNGTSGNSCSAQCRLRYCGDGILNTDLDEDCEPQAEEYYRATGSGDELVLERIFNAPVCGNYCTPPTCDEEGFCEGGCTMQFLPACQASASSTAAGSSVSSTTSSAVSAPASSAGAPAASSRASSTLSSRASSAAVSAQSSAAGVPPAKGPTGLSVAMEGPLAVQTGQNAVFRITVRNRGREPVKNVVVTDYLVNYGGYGGFNLEAATGGANCRLTGVTVRCQGIDLAGSETKILQLNFVFTPSSACIQRSVQAYATVTGDVVESDEDDNETDPVWTTVRCVGGSASVTTASSSASGALMGTETVASSEAASSVTSSEAPSVSSASTAPVICGDGIMAGNEECDSGAANGAPGNVCGRDCKRVLPAAPESSFDQMRPMLLMGSGGLLGLLLLLYAFLKRKAIMGLFGRSGGSEAATAAGEAPKALDDVPLDEIEMPWRKF